MTGQGETLVTSKSGPREPGPQILASPDGGRPGGAQGNLSEDLASLTSSTC